jgi:hypothetical protein
MSKHARTAAIVLSAIVAVTSRSAGQSGVQRAIQESRELVLDFEVTQGTDCRNPASNDQITIVFSNVPGDKISPSTSVLGEDVIAEFSFSARDLVNNRLVFRRRVRDRSFLDARFIRVVNLNGDGWCGGRLSLTVDGRSILARVSLSDRKGSGPGIQDWNRGNWASRCYWEKNLQALVPAAK